MALDKPDKLTKIDDDPSSSGMTMLRQYLRQYTYIEYRKDDWFSKLLYALPANGMLKNSNTEEDAELLTG